MNIKGEIDRSSPVPYYHQLRELLQAWIEENSVVPHTRIPSEAELGERFSVSRTVVRQTLLELERDGLIYRLKGRGSFVAQPKLRQQTTELTSFTQDARERGALARSRVLTQEMRPAGETVARRLQISPETPIFLLKRVRLADNQPVVVQAAHLSFDGCEGLLQEDFAQHSLYGVLSVRFGITPFQAEEEYEASIVRPTEASLLGLRADSPVMRTRRTTYDEDLRPYEFVRGVSRGDTIRYVGLLRRVERVPGATQD